MTKREELDLFIEKTDELIESKYILADIKIVNVLKTIAQSDTLLAIFKNCLTDFDYNEAKKKYLTGNAYLSDDKGQFILPTSSKELLAFIFNVLVDLDARRIDLREFLDKYFYEDGSFSTGYTAFINSMIKPFRNSVKMLMESVIEGKLQDPIEAFCEEEERANKEKQEKERQKIKEKELSDKEYGKSVKAIKEMLLADKKRIKDKNIKENTKKDLTLIVDMFAGAIDSSDKDAVNYSYLAYKYCVKAHKGIFHNNARKTKRLVTEILNGL